MLLRWESPDHAVTLACALKPAHILSGNQLEPSQDQLLLVHMIRQDAP